MHLFLTTVDECGQLREYSCPLQQLETAFDILNDIVAQGYTLISSRIIDDNQAMSLPVEAFDGVCFLTAMMELEQEWETILNEPVRLASSTHHEMRQLIRQRLEQTAARIANTEQTHDRLKIIRQRAQGLATRRPTATNLVGYYDSLLNRYEVQLAKARFIHQVILDRLGRYAE